MTAILESYHTHADGEASGWWGEIWHPAHFGEGGKVIKGTAWVFRVQNASTLQDAQSTAKQMVIDARINNTIFTHD